MRTGGGNKKGSAFERKVCKALSLWVSGGKHEDLFWRTAMSGGRATVARKKGRTVRQSGDICAVDRDGHSFTNRWYVETKAYAKIDLDSFIIKNKGRLAKWWGVCKREAKHYGREPMLIVKQNGWPWLVVTYTGSLDKSVTPLLMVDNINISLFTDMIMIEAKYR